MQRMNRRHRLRFLGAGVGLLLVGGCKTFEVDVTVEPDGSGRRSVELTMESSSDEESDPALGVFRQLFGLSEARGWRSFTEMPEGEDSLLARRSLGFRRQATITDLAGWQQQSGDIHIRGSVDERTHANVEFQNSILVETGRGQGGRTFTYRESFTWTGLMEAIVPFIARQFCTAMQSQYPFLEPEDVAELRGLVTGHLALRGALFEEPEDLKPDFDAIAESVAAFAGQIVRRRRPGADVSSIARIAEREVGTADELDHYLEENLPGAYMAAFTDIEIRVKMPGTIVESNADEIEDGTASWSVEVWDALAAPVELFVRSKLAG